MSKPVGVLQMMNHDKNNPHLNQYSLTDQGASPMSTSTDETCPVSFPRVMDMLSGANCWNSTIQHEYEHGWYKLARLIRMMVYLIKQH